MRKVILSIAVAVLFSFVSSAQNYISKNATANGYRNVETTPAIFEHQTEQYVMSWNYIKDEGSNTEYYYLTVMSNDQSAAWNVSIGDKLYLGLVLEDEYIELSSFMEATPEAYETPYGTKYRTLAYYLIPSTAYDKLFKGFDRFKMDVRVNNSVPVRLAVKLPYSSIEHMLMSYLEMMIATGR